MCVDWDVTYRLAMPRVRSPLYVTVTTHEFVYSSSSGYKLSLSARLISSGVGSLGNRSISTPYNRSKVCHSFSLAEEDWGDRS